MKLSIDDVWQERFDNKQQPRKEDHRSPCQRDRARILHSAAFRRLQTKTQVHGIGSNDFHRTRLTHSLEVSQIGTGILAQLERKHPELQKILPSSSLIESLCLAHDIGHPPYGHGGEVALNYMMRDYGGFEGNAQTFRILCCLEPYSEFSGMNLTRRTLLGTMKYPALLSRVQASEQALPVSEQRKLIASDWKPAKGIYDIDRALFDAVISPFSEQDREHLSRVNRSNSPLKHNKTQFKSLDCSIMELADDIAYGIHDLEDAIVLNLVSRQQWKTAEEKLLNSGDEWFKNNMKNMSQLLFSDKHHERKEAIGAIVNVLVTNISIGRVKAYNFEHSLLAYNAYLPSTLSDALDVFKEFVSQYVIQVHNVQIFTYKGQQMIMDLFEVLSADPNRLLPDSTKIKWQNANKHSFEHGMRVICDYLAGMTDGYARKLHQQLFSTHF